jgi:hypothetical protein
MTHMLVVLVTFSTDNNMNIHARVIWGVDPRKFFHLLFILFFDV